MNDRSFSGSSDTNRDSLLWNATYTRPPRLRDLFDRFSVQSEPTYDSLLHWIVPALGHHFCFRSFSDSSIVAIYQRILTTLDSHFFDMLRNNRDTNYGSSWCASLAINCISQTFYTGYTASDEKIYTIITCAHVCGTQSFSKICLISCKSLFIFF